MDQASTTLAAADQEIADRAAKRLAVRLALAAALAGANASVVYATASIIGAGLAPSPGFATLPLTAFVIGMACGTLPIGAIARRHGRRAALLVGAFCGAICGVTASVATVLWSFPLLCAATFFGGVYAAASQSYRFAATDGASPRLQPKVISWVMAGGVLAGVIGPQLVQHTMDLWAQHLFAVTYLGQAAVAILAMLVLAGVKPPPIVETSTEGARPLGEIVGQSQFVVAAICGTVSYGLMNMVMTAAPLAMKLCGLPLSDSNLGLQWHILGMYVPSFFTGALIVRFGVTPIVALGLALEVVAAIVGLSGQTVWHYWITLTLLGVGWNFAFVGASSMIVALHRPQERTRVQSFNDFIIFGTMAVGSFASGQMLAGGGWDLVNWIVFPLAVIALVSLFWSRSPVPAAAPAPAAEKA